MGSLLFRGRFLRTLLPDNTDFNWSTWESNVGTSNGICQCLRKLSSYIRDKNFDFTNLTPSCIVSYCSKKKRNAILHVGPTNSGKTYHALKHQESSSSGIYRGPMRILAWEVAQRMNRAGVPCDLITGQEKEEVDGAKHKAVTVEMADVTSDYDCAVDKIQGAKQGVFHLPEDC